MGMVPELVPSIVDESQFLEAWQFFVVNYGLNATGYIQWAKVSAQEIDDKNMT
jgi:hypothetical protein